MKKATKILFFVLVLSISWSILPEGALAQTTYYVDASGGGDFLTIQDALTAASDGDTIVVRDGTYTENILFVTKELTIRSENGYATTTVVSASGDHVFLASAANVTIEGFTIYGATNLQKYAISVGLKNNCRIANNRCGYDATHKNYYGISLYSDNSVVTNNICNYNIDGGIGVHSSNNITVTSNTSRYNGSGFVMSSVDTVSVTNNNFSDNNNWGAGTITVTNVTFRGNLIENNGSWGIMIDTGPVPDLGANDLADKGRNTIRNNGIDVYNNTSSSVNAYYNYWGVITAAEIEDHIYDDNDDGSKGAILFNPWLTSDQSLPVGLLSFAATAEGGRVTLCWITECEVNNLGFILGRCEKSRQNWQEIASYKTHSALRGQGNTSTRTEYRFTDEDVHQGLTYAYSLSDVDIQGKVTLRDIIEITLETAHPQETKLDPPFPNPANPGTKISYHLCENTEICLDVVDLLGRTVCKLLTCIKQSAGSYTIYWNGKNDNGRFSPSGIYFIILRAVGSIRSQKIILLR